jgi:hypothetical protein
MKKLVTLILSVIMVVSTTVGFSTTVNAEEIRGAGGEYANCVYNTETKTLVVRGSGLIDPLYLQDSTWYPWNVQTEEYWAAIQETTTIILDGEFMLDAHSFDHLIYIENFIFTNQNCKILDEYYTLTSTKKITIYGYYDSYIQSYAEKYNHRFIPLDDIMGDLNADGIINVRDITLLQKICVGMVEPAKNQKVGGNVD